MEEKIYTIKDIARLAGVSAGTVDRVLHARGEVSKKSREKVQKVLDEINYEPNVFAIGLAAKKKYTILCFIPHHIESDYWFFVAQGIERAASEMMPFNVRVEYQYYNHASAESYVESARMLIERQPDAVVIAPNFQQETLFEVEKLRNQNIPFVFIDSDVEGAEALTYIGQDSYQSGFMVAKMLFEGKGDASEVVLFRTKHTGASSENQVQRRLAGFMHYLEISHTQTSLFEVALEKSDRARNQVILTEFFAAHPKTKLGVMFNSRVYQIADFLKEQGMCMDSLIGYDLLPRSVQHLKEQRVSKLLGQRPGLQGYSSIRMLCDSIVFKKKIEAVRYMPIDILTMDNIDYYFEFV